jgi:hypothetical protein
MTDPDTVYLELEGRLEQYITDYHRWPTGVGSSR